MSGHCDFCQVWHSGSCCHPGRHRVADLEAKLGASQYHATPHSEVDALRARVRELEGALRAVLDCPTCADPDCCKAAVAHASAVRAARALLPAPAPGRDTNNGGTDAA